MSEIESSTLVVYTAISRGYDSLKKRVKSDVDYVAFLDLPEPCASWTVRPLACISNDPNRNAKIHKVLSHLYFPERLYSIWIDGKAALLCEPRTLAEELLSDFDMVVHRHPKRTCAYHEAFVCKNLHLDDPTRIDAQMQRYRRDGFSENMGLYDNTVILRRHNDRVRAFNELWWAEIQSGSRRDQLSSVYAAHKVGLRVGFFRGVLSPNDPDRSEVFRMWRHKGRRKWTQRLGVP
jgi:hypothetical protein